MKKGNLSQVEMREAILKANPGLLLTFVPKTQEWLFISPENASINLVEELGVYTLKPDMTLPETENLPGFKQLVINGQRICFVISQNTWKNFLKKKDTE